MARADLLVQLVEASLSGHQGQVRRVVEALTADEKAKRHTVLAKELGALLDRPLPSAQLRSPQASPQALDGLEERDPQIRLSDLVLPAVVREDLQYLIDEQQRTDLLRAYNLEPRNRVLLTGPPGNGKTSCAEALATELSLPLYVLNYESVVTSLLGETAAQLANLFDRVRRQQCVLLIDEFEVVAKERSDAMENGEMKRVVSTLLLQIDKLPAHVVLVAATNHADLLDLAVWRRFQLRLELPPPSRSQRVDFVDNLNAQFRLGLKLSSRTLVNRLGAASYAELAEFVTELRRRQILSGVAEGVTGEQVDSLLNSWRRRGRTGTQATDDRSGD